MAAAQLSAPGETEARGSGRAEPQRCPGRLGTRGDSVKVGRPGWLSTAGHTPGPNAPTSRPGILSSFPAPAHAACHQL